MDNTINKGLIGSSLYSTYYTGTAPAELTGEEIPYIVRTDDSRSLDEKLFKVRYVVPKEIVDAKDPTDGFILQDSSSTGVTNYNFTGVYHSVRFSWDNDTDNTGIIDKILYRQ